MDLIDSLNICLFGKGTDEEEKKKKASKIVDKVIEKNKKTFDELGKH